MRGPCGFLKYGWIGGHEMEGMTCAELVEEAGTGVDYASRSKRTWGFI